MMIWQVWLKLKVSQIRAELVYHNIVLYPFDTDENDDEELRLNERIRVSLKNLRELWEYR